MPNLRYLRYLDHRIAELNGNPNHIDTPNLPHYSSNIKDAWPLFEEMGKSFFLGASVTYKKGFDVWEIDNDGDGMHIVSHCQTAPEAIARAWIDWKEGK